ncbi:DUF2690 domain-containing protein [Actinoplanes sp. NPDC049596]|uniref:DUF2690 domain-containing protein n=1 Tax=unclassified Actinoplanes TaxID=2626549 RepID=UPI0034347DCC
MTAFVAMAGGLAVATTEPAAAAGCYGPTCTGRAPGASGCLGDQRRIDARQAWGTNGDVAAYVEVWHSNACGSAWLLTAVPFSAYNGTTSWIWNEPGTSQEVIGRVNTGFVPSPMVDDRPGIKTCFGTQVYRYGAKYTWNFYRCYT